jgi:hypothetical protein
MPVDPIPRPSQQLRQFTVSLTAESTRFSSPSEIQLVSTPSYSCAEPKDPTGANVPGADVTATQVDTGLKRSVKTDANGAYTLPTLPLGGYRWKRWRRVFAPMCKRESYCRWLIIR